MTDSKQAWGLLLLSVVILSLASCQPEHRFTVGDLHLDIPEDSEYEWLKLNLGSHHGKVRIYGDGRFSVWEQERKTREITIRDGRLTDSEMAQLLGGVQSVVDFDSKVTRRRLNNVAVSCPPSGRSLIIRARGGRKGSTRFQNDMRWVTEAQWFRLHRASSQRPLEEFRILIQQLVALRDHPTSRRRLPSPARYSRPSWSKSAASDTPRLAFRVAASRNEPGGFYTYDLESQKLSRWIDLGSHSCTSTGRSPLISHLYGVLCRGIEGLQLHTRRVPGGELLVEGYRNSHSAVWSPDGKLMAISVEGPEKKWTALVLEARTGRVVSRYPEAQPRFFSLDGRLLYVFQHGLRPPEVRVFEVGEGNGKRIVRSDSVKDASISPDGRWIAWTSNKPDVNKNQGRRLFVARRSLRQGTAARFARHRHVTTICGSFDWSPSSQEIVVHACDNSISVIGLHGHHRILWRSDTGPILVGRPNWSPDGNAIAFWTRAAGRMAVPETGIWIVGADGADPRFISRGGTPLWFGEDTSPEGDPLLYY